MSLYPSPYKCFFTLTRRGIFIGFSSLVLSLGRAEAQKIQTKVLFVCQYGSVKSAIAREVFKRAAADRGLSVSVSSRGITPEEHMTPELAAQLKADGIDPNAQALQVLAQTDIDNADIVVTFDALPESMSPKVLRVWSGVPPMTKDYARARSALDSRIAQLMSEILKAQE